MRSLISAHASLLLAFLLQATMSRAWQACNSGNGTTGGSGDSGICPAFDTCCATSTPGVSTCISGKEKESGGDPGSCCLDDDDADYHDNNNITRTSSSPFATTGCGPGFQCAKDPANNSYRYCQRIDDNDKDNPPRLPRYRLCSLPEKALKEVYGFPVAPYTPTTTASTLATEQEKATSPLLFAYYSNMGPIYTEESTDNDNDMLFAKVKKVVIVIHGSGRNADDYLCCMNAALPPIPGRSHGHADPTNSTILVISPWFLSPDDLPINITTTTSTAAAEPLVWEDEDGPIEHTWYGHFRVA
jgi:hypothetical protein